MNNRANAPLTVGGTRISPWSLAMILFMMWPVWVLMNAPTPIPPRTLTLSVIGIVAPLLIVATIMLFHTVHHRQDRLDFLAERGFKKLAGLDRDIMRDSIRHSGWGLIGIHDGRLIEGWSTQSGFDQQHLIMFYYGSGKSRRLYFALGVQVTSFDTSIAFEKCSRFDRWLKGFFLSTDAGPDWFRRRWIVKGDPEIARSILDEEVCQVLDGSSINRPQKWLWRYDTLWLILRGKPTAAGIERTLTHLRHVAEVGGLMPAEDRSPEPVS